jgi:hypothetical protein
VRRSCLVHAQNSCPASFLLSPRTRFLSRASVPPLSVLSPLRSAKMTMPLSKALKELETRQLAMAFGKPKEEKGPFIVTEEKEIRLYGGLMFDTKRQFINKLVRRSHRHGGYLVPVLRFARSRLEPPVAPPPHSLGPPTILAAGRVSRNAQSLRAPRTLDESNRPHDVSCGASPLLPMCSLNSRTPPPQLPLLAIRAYRPSNKTAHSLGWRPSKFSPFRAT